MLKTIIVLPDGTQIASGAGTVNAIQCITLTECVNSGEELTIGSVCANSLEVSVITPAGNLSVSAGTEITAYREDENARTKLGVFILEKPTRKGANTMKIVGYDRVSKLDKDLTAWLSGLSGWPYTLGVFAGMVCSACGLTYEATDVPNADFPVQKFSRTSVTGRQLMQWIGEACGRFCRATPDGNIEFAWYEPSGMTISSSGSVYYMRSSLSYEDYKTEQVGAVQIRLADSDAGALWPAAEEGANSYIISGNPILGSSITAELPQVLENIKSGGLGSAAYTPCKVSIPATMAVHAGSIVQIVDVNGKSITAYVMTKTQSGMMDTLQCTGSQRRDSSAVLNNKTPSQKAEDAASQLTQEELFKRLTNNGVTQGIFLSPKDKKIYINLEYLVSEFISANLIKAGVLRSKDDTSVVIDLDNGTADIVGTVTTRKGSSLGEGYYAKLSPDGIDISDGTKAGTSTYGFFSAEGFEVYSNERSVFGGIALGNTGTTSMGISHLYVPDGDTRRCSADIRASIKQDPSIAGNVYSPVVDLVLHNYNDDYVENKGGYLLLRVHNNRVLITGLTDPVDAADAARKGYVDSQIAALRAEIAAL